MTHAQFQMSKGRQCQRGVSLIAVLALLLLSLMAVMGAMRVANLNELLLGNSTDYNRTYAAAEAMMNDAEMDIRGRRPPFTTIQADGNFGLPCRATTATSTTTAPCFLGCRQINGPLASACAVPVASTNPFIPEGEPDFDEVDRRVAANTNTNFSSTRRCMEGICIPLNTTDLANIENNLSQMTPLGATYGQFTRANAYDVAPGASSNPILTATGPARAWYWIEVFRYQKEVCGLIGTCITNVNAPDERQPFVFRITAIAQGQKLDAAGNPTTRVVLKSIFVPSIDPS